MALRYREVLAMAAAGALLGGWAGGRIAANTDPPALPRTSLGPAVEAMTAGAGRSGAVVARAGLTPVDFEKLAASCENCSDFQLGYRLAEREGVSETADCDAYVWSYEAGCLAWLRASRS